MSSRRSTGCLSAISVLFGLLTLIKSPPGIPGGLIWLPKLWAEAWAPFLAILGGLGALLGWMNKDRRGTWTGLLGLVLGIRYTLRVTAQPDRFSTVFGSDWADRIPAHLKARLTAGRYQWIRPAVPRIPGTRNVILGWSGKKDHPLLCDIWEPPGDTPRTGLAMLFLHGGLWQALDKDFLTQPLFRRLAAQGHVIMDVAYSLSPGSGLDEMLREVRQAILWLKTHAGDYGVNSGRIVLMGVSGGAHLALLTAYAPAHPAFQDEDQEADMSVRGVISVSGVTDLRSFFREYGQSNPRQPEYSSQITDDIRPRIYDKTLLDRFMTRSRAFPAYRHANMPGGPLLLVYLLGGTLNELPEVYRVGSPVAHAGPHCPPTLLVYGEDDFVVNVSHGRRLHQALRATGVASIYIELPETVHAFDQYIGVSPRVAPAAQSVAYSVDRFLAILT